MKAVLEVPICCGRSRERERSKKIQSQSVAMWWWSGNKKLVRFAMNQKCKQYKKSKLSCKGFFIMLFPCQLPIILLINQSTYTNTVKRTKTEETHYYWYIITIPANNDIGQSSSSSTDPSLHYMKGYNLSPRKHTSTEELWRGGWTYVAVFILGRERCCRDWHRQQEEPAEGASGSRRREQTSWGRERKQSSSSREPRWRHEQ